MTHSSVGNGWLNAAAAYEPFVSRECNKIGKILRIFDNMLMVDPHLLKYLHDFSDFIALPACKQLASTVASSQTMTTLPYMVKCHMAASPGSSSNSDH